ncbi:MAG: MFS transporter [Candidatus Tectomicrobia bacterium]|uniref:MFS transporter n=1 Tax=Tectimicrobiota bacterium TaxID=2528274 RepID=A0A938B6E6_UNCTE|nr:MFS transporter [Candidatus Tectomicrobia bacterium]
MTPTAVTADQPPEPGRPPLALVGILSEGFLSHLSSGVMAFALPLYARHLGLSVAEVGILLSLHLSVSLALKPFTGRVADWLGYRRGASAATVFRSLLSFLLAAAGTPWHLFGLQAARGVAKAVRDPAMHALIAARGGKKRLASTFAWYQTADGTAGPLGRALAGVLLTATAANFRCVFALAAALSVLPVVVLSFSRTSQPDETAPRPARPQAPGDTSTGTQPLTALLPFVDLGALISGTAHMLHGLMPVLLVEYAGLNEAQAGILYLVSTVVMLVATPIFGWLCDHAHRELVLLIRSLANVLSSVLYLLVPTFAGFACAKALNKMGTAAFRPAWALLMAEASVTDPTRRAQRLGLMSAGDDAGSIAGPVLAGAVWSTWGIPALLGTRIALALVAEGYTLLFTRTMARAARPPDSPEPPGTARPVNTSPASFLSS